MRLIEPDRPGASIGTRPGEASALRKSLASAAISAAPVRPPSRVWRRRPFALAGALATGLGLLACGYMYRIAASQPNRISAVSKTAKMILR